MEKLDKFDGMEKQPLAKASTAAAQPLQGSHPKKKKGFYFEENEKLCVFIAHRMKLNAGIKWIKIS